MKVNFVISLPVSDLRRFVIIFYVVGVVGFMLPFTRPLFVYITPFALLVNYYLLACFHPHSLFRLALISLFVFITGFVIEVAGVKTGILFGPYAYGSALGVKLADTPLLIGMNWVLLSYMATDILSRTNFSNWQKTVLAPGLMVVYDLVLEQVAPRLDMWSWYGGGVPFRNYLVWYIVSLFMVIVWMQLKGIGRNPLAPLLFLCQFFFFCLLALILPL